MNVINISLFNHYNTILILLGFALYMQLNLKKVDRGRNLGMYVTTKEIAHELQKPIQQRKILHFWGILKNELVYNEIYETRQQAIDDITKYIELDCNQSRI